jgi:hypothetical protein
MISLEGAYLAVKDAKFVQSLTHAGHVKMIGTFREKGALIIVLRANTLQRIQCGTINVKIARRIALNAISEVLARNAIHGLIF